jgi:hypothetical protein
LRARKERDTLRAVFRPRIRRSFRSPLRPSMVSVSAAVVACVVSVTACGRSGFGSDFEGEITFRTTRLNTPPGTMVIKAKGNRFRIEIPTPNGKIAAALFLAGDNRVIVFDDAHMTATERDLGSPFAPAPDSATSAAEKTGKTETLAGIGCDDYAVKMDGGTRIDACLAKGLPFLDLDVIRQGGHVSQWSRDLRANRWFPLRAVEYAPHGNQEVSRIEVTAVTKSKLDDAIFEVPAGYTRVTRAQ